MFFKFDICGTGIDFLLVDEDSVGIPDKIYIEMSLYRGNQQLAKTVSTAPVPYDDDHR